MRIIAITQDEPFYLPLLFDRMRNLWEKHESTIIILPSAQNGVDFLKLVKKHYDLYGFPVFLQQASKFAVLKTLNFFLGLSPSPRFYSVALFAQKNQIPCLQMKNLQDQQSLRQIKNLKPDLIISIAPPQIFPQKLLAIPEFGCINIHQGLLPQYQGINPSFWALLNSEKETGVTVHFMDQKIDHGPILLQQKVKISPQETLHSLYLKNIGLGARLLTKAVRLIENDDYQTLPNPQKKASYFSFPDKQSARKFRKSGNKFF